MLLNSAVLYDKFCDEHKEIIPLFHQPWWLEIVCQFGTIEKYIITDEYENIIGIFPIYTKRKMGFQWHTCPPFCLFLGPVLLKEKTLSKADFTQLHQQSKAMYSLLISWQSIAEDMLLNGNFEVSWMNTFRLDTSKNTHEIFQNFSDSTRLRIKKAQKELNISQKIEISNFFQLYEKHQKSRNIYQKTNTMILNQLITAAYANDQGIVFTAFDAKKKSHGAIFVVNDTTTSWCLVTIKDDAIKPNNCNRLLLWEAIKNAHNNHQIFDFEGGDLSGIGDFFASFGAEKVPFIRAIRYKSPFIKKTVKFIKNVLHPQHSTFH
jgi:hypothetical protein